MLRHMAANDAAVTAAIGDAINASRDGTPKAQRKMEQRIKAAGALSTQLTTGTRGRYSLLVETNTGFNPITNTRIRVGDLIPPKPCVGCWSVLMDGRHRGPPPAMPIVFISHHALSRSAQRWGLLDAAYFFSKLARSVLRHIHVASRQELKDRIMAAMVFFNQEPVVHLDYKLDKAAYMIRTLERSFRQKHAGSGRRRRRSPGLFWRAAGCGWARSGVHCARRPSRCHRPRWSQDREFAW
jgi:hypothetical protein